MRGAWSVLLALGVAACGLDPLGPVSVRAPTTVSATSTPIPEFVRVDIPVEITNGTDRTLLFGCPATRLERLTGGEWRETEVVVCAAALFPLIEILPRTTQIRTVSHSVRTTDVPGTYRVRAFLMVDDGRQVPEDQQISNSFEVIR